MLYKDKATKVLVERPDCDMCGGSGTAAVDGKTRMGPWGYMCIGCFAEHGLELGMGRGQVLLCDDALDESLISRYQLKETA